MSRRTRRVVGHRLPTHGMPTGNLESNSAQSQDGHVGKGLEHFHVFLMKHEGTILLNMPMLKINQITRSEAYCNNS
nr:hypothetical protein [Tanacetum cinerariifolium]